MKNASKSVFFLLLALILVFSAVSYFGVDYKYGDTTTDYVKGLTFLRWGGEATGYTDVVLNVPEESSSGTDSSKETGEIGSSFLGEEQNQVTPGDGESVLEEGLSAKKAEEQGKKDTQLDAKKGQTVIEERLALMGVDDWFVSYSPVVNAYTVRLPYDAKYPDAAGTIATTLSAQGQVELREGTDETGTLIFDSADVSSAKIYQASGYSSIILQLNKQGAKKLEEASTRLKGSEEKVTLRMDGVSLTQTNFTEVIKNGQMTFSPPSSSSEGAIQMAAKINGGPLPWALTEDHHLFIPPVLTESSVQQAQTIFLCGVLLVVLVYLIFYRLSALAACLTFLGEAAALFAYLTGFYPDGYAVLLTRSRFLGMAVGMGVALLIALLFSSRIRTASRKSEKGLLLEDLKSAISRSRSVALTLLVSVFFIGVILMGTFGPVGTASYYVMRIFLFWMQNSYNAVVYQFAQTLTYTAVLAVIFQLLLYPWMVKSLASFESLRRRSLWGGGKA